MEGGLEAKITEGGKSYSQFVFNVLSINVQLVLLFSAICIIHCERASAVSIESGNVGPRMSNDDTTFLLQAKPSRVVLFEFWPTHALGGSTIGPYLQYSLECTTNHRFLSYRFQPLAGTASIGVARSCDANAIQHSCAG